MLQKGDRVKCVVVIQSDDRENGIDDSTPILEIGTEGVVIGRSDEFIEEGCHLKEGAEDCMVVQFNLSDSTTWNFDVSEDEVVKI